MGAEPIAGAICYLPTEVQVELYIGREQQTMEHQQLRLQLPKQLHHQALIISEPIILVDGVLRAVQP